MCYCSGDTPARPACPLHFFLDNPPLLVNFLIYFNPFTARVLGGVCKMTLTFESVNEILWCDHSNESSPPVLSHGAMCFSKFYKMKLANLVEIFLWLHLVVKGLSFLHYVHDACGVKISKIKLSLVFLLLFDPEASNLALLFIYYSFSPFTGVAMDPIWLWASRRLWPQRLHIGLYSSHLGLMVSGTCGFLQCRFVRPTPNPSTCCWVALPRVWVSNRDQLAGPNFLQCRGSPNQADWPLSNFIQHVICFYR